MLLPNPLPFPFFEGEKTTFILGRRHKAASLFIRLTKSECCRQQATKKVTAAALWEVNQNRKP